MSITLFSSILSRPVNAAVAALVNAPAKIEIEAIWIRGAISGRLKTLVAKNPESKKETADNAEA